MGRRSDHFVLPLGRGGIVDGEDGDFAISRRCDLTTRRVPPHFCRFRGIGVGEACVTVRDAGAAGGSAEARLGVDIGGTFTDVALESGGAPFQREDPDHPRRSRARRYRGDRRRAAEPRASRPATCRSSSTARRWRPTRSSSARAPGPALVTTEGFRDTVEIRHENRFEQYDVNIDLPPPLVPRRLRFVVPERIDARGRVNTPLDEGAVEAIAERLSALGIESVAIGFLHSFTNPAHEQRTRDILAALLPGVSFTLSSEVSPEMREYERFSTACANAYVQPMIGRYLRSLEERLGAEGFRLSAVPDAVGRRANDGRDGDPLSGAAGRERTGRRRDLRQPHRPAMRLRARCCPTTWAARPRRSV